MDLISITMNYGPFMLYGENLGHFFPEAHITCNLPGLTNLFLFSNPLQFQLLLNDIVLLHISLSLLKFPNSLSLYLSRRSEFTNYVFL